LCVWEDENVSSPVGMQLSSKIVAQMVERHTVQRICSSVKYFVPDLHEERRERVGL